MSRLRRKVLNRFFNIEGTAQDYAQDMLNHFEWVVQSCPECQTDEDKYALTVSIFLEKWYVGTADTYTAKNMIMSAAKETAEATNKPFNLQLVAVAAIGTYIGSRQKKPPQSALYHVSLFNAVCEVIPESL
ncbi:MAG: hypothetical protein OXT74_18615 [Candidatus Poribacteria bacterium]|nr:hypothetical protein [Candidatus Poribacteria bacterium]